MTAPYKEYSPKIDPDAFIMKQAAVIGRVTIGRGSSVWTFATIRGDIADITIGDYTNIQDNCVLHVTTDLPVTIGSYVTVGHGAIIHSAAVGDNCLIGMGSIILDKAVIGEGSIVGAGSLVPPGKQYPPNSMIIGSPARVVRSISPEDRKGILANAMNYVHVAKEYREDFSE